MKCEQKRMLAVAPNGSAALPRSSMNCRLLLPLFFLLALTTAGEETRPAIMNAFHNGESFTFHVGWGIFSHAGEIVITSKTEILEGLPQLRVSTVTSTQGLAHAVYPYINHAESIFDAKTGRLLAASEDGTDGKRQSKSMVVFDYNKREAVFRDYVRPQRSTTLTNPRLESQTGRPAAHPRPFLRRFLRASDPCRSL
jgi:hypothetical protein